MAYINKELTEIILFYKLIDLKYEFIDLESDNYKKFVRDELGEIINKNNSNETAYQIIYNYYIYLKNAKCSNIKYLLGFLKKYNLITFQIEYPSIVRFIYDENLTQQDIFVAYEKELAYVNGENKDKEITKPSIFERLDKFTTIEERQVHLKELASEYSESLKLTMQENSYYKFIMDKENGLYKVLGNALYKYDGKNFKLEYNPQRINFNYIKEFCDKYRINIKMIERNELISKDYLPDIKTLEDIRNLFNCFFMELQQIERFSKTKEELWEEYNEFVANNEDWLKNKSRNSTRQK